MNNLEVFASEVAALVTGKSQEEAAAEVAAYNENKAGNPAILVWIQLVMDIVMEVVEKCRENNVDKIVNRVKHPGLVNAVRFNRLLAKRMKEYEAEESSWDVSKAFHDVVSTKDDAFVKDVVTQVKKPDYWLV